MSAILTREAVDVQQAQDHKLMLKRFGTDLRCCVAAYESGKAKSIVINGVRRFRCPKCGAHVEVTA